jgi:hypothetical protein
LIGSFQVSNKSFGHPHTSLLPLLVWPNMQDNGFFNLVSHKNIRSIKIHMRNMRNISVSIRSIVSGLDVLLFFLLDTGFSEFNEFLTFCVQP